MRDNQQKRAKIIVLQFRRISCIDAQLFFFCLPRHALIELILEDSDKWVQTMKSFYFLGVKIKNNKVPQLFKPHQEQQNKALSEQKNTFPTQLHRS